MKRVVIIGGGISGLAAAYSLREHQSALKTPAKDFEILLLEKRDRIGGNIRTEKVDGFIIEGGPDCFISEKPWAMELCKRVGLTEDLLTTNEKFRKTYVLSGGKLHVLPEGVILMVPTKMFPLATSSLISFSGKLRMAYEYFVPRRKDKADESLGDFVRRRLGEEALEKIAEPLVAGVHAGDPETMSVKASFPKFVQLEQEHGSLIKGMLMRMAAFKKGGSGGSGGKGGQAGKGGKGGAGKKVTMFMSLKGGLTEFVSTLRERLLAHEHTSIRTGVAVAGVVKKDGGYEVNIEGGPPIEADSVVIAAPAYAAASLVKGLDGELSEKLLSIPYVSTATVSVAFKKSEISHPLNGFGFVVPKTEKRKIMAATWTSVKWSHRAPPDTVLIRCFVGGSKDAGLVNLSDAEMVSMVRNELKEIMGIEAEPVLAKVYRWINSMPQYTIGHEERVKWLEERSRSHPGLFLTGSAYHGIGIADSVRYGEVVAKKVLHRITG
jgi:oxygen-dependent protoporphyrinogen oxidase